MVNSWTGEYKYDPDEPAETRCNLDDVCDILTKEYHYTPQNISLEELAMRVLAFAEDDENVSLDLYSERGDLNVQVFRDWLYDNQPVAEFDYQS